VGARVYRPFTIDTPFSTFRREKKKIQDSLLLLQKKKKKTFQKEEVNDKLIDLFPEFRTAILWLLLRQIRFASGLAFRRGTVYPIQQ